VNFNAGGLGFAPVIAFSANCIAHPLYVRSHTRIQLPCPLYCVTLSGLNRTRAVGVSAPNRVITLRPLFHIQASIFGHERQLPRHGREISCSCQAPDSGTAGDRRLQVSPRRPGTLCRSDVCGPGLDRLHAPALGR
jgi:hypothetical protein